MMNMLKTIIWGPEPVEPDPDQVTQVLNMQAKLIDEIIAVKRTSYQIRRELVGDTVDYIARKK